MKKVVHEMSINLFVPPFSYLPIYHWVFFHLPLFWFFGGFVLIHIPLYYVYPLFILFIYYTIIIRSIMPSYFHLLDADLV